MPSIMQKRDSFLSPEQVVNKLEHLLQWRHDACNEEGMDATDTLIAQLLQRAYPSHAALQGILNLLYPYLGGDDIHGQTFALACLKLLAQNNARMLSETNLAHTLLPLLKSTMRDVQRTTCDTLELLLAEYSNTVDINTLYDGLMEVRQEACGVLVNAAVNEAVNTGLTTSHHHLVVSHPHSTTTVSDTTPSPAQGHAVNSEGKKGGITPAETPLPQAAVAGDTRVTRGQGTGGQTGGQTEGQQHTSVQDTHAAVAAPPTAPSTASPTASPTALPTAQTMADNDHIESPALSGRRKSAAVACRRYASVLVYQLLHINGASGNVGLRFLQHATMLVEGGDVADHLFVVQCLKHLTISLGPSLGQHFDLGLLLPLLQHNHAELARNVFEVLLQLIDVVVTDALLVEGLLSVLSSATEQPLLQAYSLYIITHYMVTREAENTPPSPLISTTTNPPAPPLSPTYARLVQEKMGEVLVSLLSQHDREAQDAAATALHWVVVTLTTAAHQQQHARSGCQSNSTWAHTVLHRFAQLGGLRAMQALHAQHQRSPSPATPITTPLQAPGAKMARHGSLTAPVSVHVLAASDARGSFVFVDPLLYDQQAAMRAVQAFLKARNHSSEEDKVVSGSPLLSQPSLMGPARTAPPIATRSSLTMEGVEAVRKVLVSALFPSEVGKKQ